ncbi:universal stress protein [Microlunatus ginsengisoli]|uniref:Universal stress protein n=1 Tax=Microlunatus ginsengisoli TaxID=363863 RepID=A0ABP7ARN0_9ACTN
MTYVVGYSPWHTDFGVLDFAAQLARSDGHRLRVVVAVPDTWPTPVARGSDREFGQWAAQQGSDAVAEAQRVLGDNSPDVEAEVVWESARSVPPLLLSQADTVGADLIVVGSAQHGPSGQITISSKANRLLHSSPIPVALAPRAYHPVKGSKITRITCAFRGDEASRATLSRAAAMCKRTGQRLRVATFGVRGRRMYPPEVSGAEQVVLDAWLEQSREAQKEAIAATKAEHEFTADVDGLIAVGRSWADAMDDVDWNREDVLVVGSSSTGTFSQIFLGSSAAKIVRFAPVPVVVVP